MKYHSGIGKLLHSMQWTRPEIYNAIWKLSCDMTMASELHTRQCLLQWIIVLVQITEDHSLSLQEAEMEKTKRFNL